MLFHDFCILHSCNVLLYSLVDFWNDFDLQKGENKMK